jgi:glycine/D-amino acid oxidase-like deaminating enzyme
MHAFTGTADFGAVERRLHAYLPEAAKTPITHRWTGPVALTWNRICAMGVRGAHRNVYYALGYAGHGVTLANLAGRVLTDAYSDADERWRGLPSRNSLACTARNPPPASGNCVTITASW